MPRRKRKTQNKKKNSMQTVFTRYMLIIAVFTFWIFAIGVRLVHLQVSQHEWLSEKAKDQRRYEHKSKMLRGTIFDRSDRALAMSIKVKSLYADPTEIDDLEETAKQVSKVLKLNRKQVLKDLKIGKEKKRRFVWLARKLDEKDFQKVNETLAESDLKKFDLPKFSGLHWKEEQKRSYPYKSLAAHLIGFTNSEHLGRAGVEMSQETALKGEMSSKMRERDRLGRVYGETSNKTAKPNDVVLTISNSIQYKTEEALAKGVKKANAKSGRAIVLDPKTGEILAMANYPTFDPNDFRNIKPQTWKNRAIQDSYTPGSVFKLITYGSALEEDLIEADSMINCGDGQITVSGHTFNDSHAVGTVSYVESFAQSSNVGAIKTGMRVGKKTFYNYARDFGFGEKTGVQLPAETSGILRSPKTWSGDSLASMSIGYEIGVTALQSAVAFATIANDGIKVQPHVIKEIRQSDGQIVSKTEPKKERVVSKATARDLRKMMRRVITDGTAKTAQLNGYTSAGKTGTAWKYDAKIKAINKNKYVSSFIGFAPADNPRIVIAIVMDEPQGQYKYGGQVAGPVFADIAEQVLPELNVTPDGTIPDDLLNDEDDSDDNENPELAEKTVVKKAEKPKEKPKAKKKEKVVKKKKDKPAKKVEKNKDKSKQKGRDKNGKKGKVTALNRKILFDNKSGAREDRKT